MYEINFLYLVSLNHFQLGCCDGFSSFHFFWVGPKIWVVLARALKTPSYSVMIPFLNRNSTRKHTHKKKNHIHAPLNSALKKDSSLYCAKLFPPAILTLCFAMEFRSSVLVHVASDCGGGQGNLFYWDICINGYVYNDFLFLVRFNLFSTFRCCIRRGPLDFPLSLRRRRAISDVAGLGGAEVINAETVGTGLQKKENHVFYTRNAVFFYRLPTGGWPLQSIWFTITFGH